jgi:hypothetical protein
VRGRADAPVARFLLNKVLLGEKPVDDYQLSFTPIEAASAQRRGGIRPKPR